MKYIVTSLVLLLIIIACHSKDDIKSTSADRTLVKRPKGYEVKQLAGVFYDTLPCADCPGIATKLYLKPDETFVMERQHIDKGVFYETGVWATNDSLLQLTGTDSPQQFKIVSYALIKMLDAQGKEIKKGAANIDWDRNNVPFKPLQPVPVEGIYRSVNDTMAIHICSMKKDYQATLAPTAMMMTAKYKETAKQGEAIYARVAGHFELRPSLKDTTTQDFFVIEKFISFQPGQACK